MSFSSFGILAFRRGDYPAKASLASPWPKTERTAGRVARLAGPSRLDYLMVFGDLPAIPIRSDHIMELAEFKLLFEAHPDKYPLVIERRHPALLQKMLTYWDVPIEAEVFFNRLATAIGSASTSPLPPDAALEVEGIRDVYKLWRQAARPRASQSVLRSLSIEEVPGILDTLKRPTPDVAEAMKTAIEMAHGDSPAIAAWLSSKNLSCNQRDMDGTTALMACAQRGQERAAIALIQAGANPHMADAAGNTALHWAVIQNKRRMAELLLYFGANPNAANAAGATSYALSAVKDDSAIAQRLYEYGADIASQDLAGNTPLHKAICAGSIENVWLLLQAGAPHSARNKTGQAAAELAEKRPEIQRIFDKHSLSLKMSAV
jgi:hypothetical protein